MHTTRIACRRMLAQGFQLPVPLALTEGVAVCAGGRPLDAVACSSESRHPRAGRAEPARTFKQEFAPDRFDEVEFKRGALGMQQQHTFSRKRNLIRHL